MIRRIYFVALLCGLQGFGAGCFAYYSFAQLEADPEVIEDPIPATVAFIVTPNPVSFFPGEQVALTATLAAPQSVDLEVNVEGGALACASATLAAGSVSVELSCTASGTTTSNTAEATVTGEGLAGSAAFSFEILSGDRFSLPTPSITVKRGSSTALALAVQLTPGLAKQTSIVLASNEPTLTVSPALGVAGAATVPLTLSVEGDAPSATVIPAELHLTHAGKLTTLPLMVTVLPRAGTLDASFGVSGRTAVDFNVASNDFNAVRAVALDSAGRVVVAGRSKELVSGTRYHRAGMARLTASGALDPSYSGDGVAIVGHANPMVSYRLSSAVLDPLDELWLCGGTTAAPNSQVLRISNTGTATGVHSLASFSGCLSLVTAGDDRVYTHIDQNGDSAIVSLHASTLVPTVLFHLDFSNFGSVDMDEGLAAVAVSGAVGAPGTSYVIGGSHELGGGAEGHAWLGRISNPASNLLDASFGVSGLSPYLSSEVDYPGYLAIVLAGNTIVSVGTADWGLELLVTKTDFATGQRVAEFGDGGVVRLSGPDQGLRGTALAIQSDGKLLIVGESLSTERRPFVLRLMPNGTPDLSFGVGGYRMLPSTLAGHASASSIALGANGEIYVGVSEGCSSDYLCDFGLDNATAHGAVFRLLP